MEYLVNNRIFNLQTIDRISLIFPHFPRHFPPLHLPVAADFPGGFVPEHGSDFHHFLPDPG